MFIHPAFLFWIAALAGAAQDGHSVPDQASGVTPGASVRRLVSRADPGSTPP
jgi:hypothetical protein